MHEHIQALLMFEINKKLEELQRKGVGYIDCEYMGGINNKIDDTIYEITIKGKDEVRSDGAENRDCV